LLDYITAFLGCVSFIYTRFPAPHERMIEDDVFEKVRVIRRRGTA